MVNLPDTLDDPNDLILIKWRNIATINGTSNTVRLYQRGARANEREPTTLVKEAFLDPSGTPEKAKGRKVEVEKKFFTSTFAIAFAHGEGRGRGKEEGVLTALEVFGLPFFKKVT